ncbi:ABC transporter permease subunit [Octadecabacter sp. G9-8]|uniref:ABC transporter permease subunit n=1 Tax=Octadecabacter dasysiphoniae TaxID=2909341 RepID=A0ABS9CR36_9RHOB|nr:ABC transporter permease subunit [Octadecabacter dasysiphoniae]MCF2869537.1 ABC transporter permease subunit [Octadecabacter dasysiphoniae]
MADTVNLVCTRERLGEVVTELRAGNVPDGQIVGDTFALPAGCEIASGWDTFSYQFGTLGAELWSETKTVMASAASALPSIAFYVIVILACMFIYRAIKSMLTPTRDYTSLKTVTFGDESAVRSDFPASVLSIILIFVIWGSFTGSALLPGFLHLPAPYTGEESFTYTVEDDAGNRDDAEIFVRVVGAGVAESEMVFDEGDGIAKNDGVEIGVYRSENVLWDSNDDVSRRENGARVVAINGQEFDFAFGTDDAGPAPSFDLDFAQVTITDRGSINVVPDQGMQMQPLYLPAPEVVWNRFIEIAKYGYQNVYLTVHLGFSLFRVIVGFMLGAAIGIPLGYAMGLSNWFRGWFDPIVEFMRPVPPLALIPLVIIWFGIGEVGKIFLLFLAALWIMAIAARSGVSGVRITKVHAAYSLGASRWQILRYVIIPNSLPEIFTGARVAMGVCWGTVVAAELVAAEEGIGKMITTASKFQNTDIILLGVIIIGLVGFGIDMLMRWAERSLVPWKGKG